MKKQREHQNLILMFEKKVCNLTLDHTFPNSDDPGERPIDSISGKGENAGSHNLFNNFECF